MHCYVIAQDGADGDVKVGGWMKKHTMKKMFKMKKD